MSGDGWNKVVVNDREMAENNYIWIKWLYMIGIAENCWKLLVMSEIYCRWLEMTGS